MALYNDKLKELLDQRKIKDLAGLQELMREMTKDVIEALYEGEMTEHLGYEKYDQFYRY